MEKQAKYALKLTQLIVYTSLKVRMRAFHFCALANREGQLRTARGQPRLSPSIINISTNYVQQGQLDNQFMLTTIVKLPIKLHCQPLLGDFNQLRLIGGVLVVAIALKLNLLGLVGN